MQNSSLCHFIGDNRNGDLLIDRLKEKNLLVDEANYDEAWPVIQSAFIREARQMLAIAEREPLPKDASIHEKLKRVVKPGDRRAQAMLCGDLEPYLSKAGLALRDQSGPLEQSCPHCGMKCIVDPVRATIMAH
jgi:hypothetical protein